MEGEWLWIGISEHIYHCYQWYFGTRIGFSFLDLHCDVSYRLDMVALKEVAICSVDNIIYITMIVQKAKTYIGPKIPLVIVGNSERNKVGIN